MSFVWAMEGMEISMRTLGVIGGMGPGATAYFMERIVDMTQAENDGGHIPVLVYNNTKIPDRTGYILGVSSENPYPELLRTGRILKEHCDCIALPCATAHVFRDRLQKDLKLPVFDMIEETAVYLKAQGITCAGLLATDGTIKGGCFQKSLKDRDIEILLPDVQQQQRIMELIYGGIKAGRAVDMEVFEKIAKSLKAQGAQAIILGCTELSIIKGRHKLDDSFLDSLEVLAAAVITECGAVLKEEYRRFIS